jgi:putative ABC transport system ATP-binding protein
VLSPISTRPAADEAPVLSLTGVWRTYRSGSGTVAALRDVTLHINRGDFMAIVGPSGSGKSTLLQLLGLLDRPSEGTVHLGGRDLAGLGDEARARLRLRAIGFVFQRFHLLSGLTALENVALPMEALGVPPRERATRAAALLESTGLGARLTFPPSKLSGGQRQRVAIARALANRPRLLLGDEPTGELHSDDKARVLDLLRQVHRDGRTVVLVTHDPEVAAAAARRIEIRDGRVKEIS